MANIVTHKKPSWLGASWKFVDYDFCNDEYIYYRSAPDFMRQHIAISSFDLDDNNERYRILEGYNQSQPSNQRSNKMNHSLAVFLVAEGVVRAMLCEYTEDSRDKKVIFKTFDPDIHKDDIVVVPTSSRIKMTTVKVIEEDVEVDMYSSTPVDWIVSKVDQQKYKDILAQEDIMLKKVKSAEKNKQRKELLASLNMAEDDLKQISFNPTAA